MLKDKRKWDQTKCSFNTREGRKWGKEKRICATKKKTGTNIVVIKPSIRIITLKVNDLNIPM